MFFIYSVDGATNPDAEPDARAADGHAGGNEERDVPLVGCFLCSSHNRHDCRVSGRTENFYVSLTVAGVPSIAWVINQIQSLPQLHVHSLSSQSNGSSN